MLLLIQQTDIYVVARLRDNLSLSFSPSLYNAHDIFMLETSQPVPKGHESCTKFNVLDRKFIHNYPPYTLTFFITLSNPFPSVINFMMFLATLSTELVAIEAA